MILFLAITVQSDLGPAELSSGNLALEQDIELSERTSSIQSISHGIGIGDGVTDAKNGKSGKNGTYLHSGRRK